MTIEAVVLDIGNVLIEWHPELVYDAVMSRAERDRLFYDVGLHEMNLRVDAGAPFAASVEALAAEYPEDAAGILMWRDHWKDMVRPDIPQSVRIMRALRARGVPVFALSNFGIDTFTMAEGMYPFLAEFDRRFISGHMGVIKPDPRIYATVEADTGIAPHGLLFADDRPENVEAAALRGWQTHLFTTPEGWADRLVAEGLLSREDAS